jgi:hypothetical protein
VWSPRHKDWVSAFFSPFVYVRRNSITSRKWFRPFGFVFSGLGCCWLVGGTAVLVVLVFVLGCRWCVLPDVFYWHLVCMFFCLFVFRDWVVKDFWPLVAVWFQKPVRVCFS